MAKPAPTDSVAKARTLVESYTFKELQRELKSRELRAAGKKQELKARLEGALVAELEASKAAAPLEEAVAGPPRALYGPVRWPRDDTSRPVAGARLVAARQQGLVNPTYSGTDRFPLKPWCKNNGIYRSTMLKLDSYIYGGSVEACVKQSTAGSWLASERGLRVFGGMQTHIVSIMEEARTALAAGRAPHGAVEYVQWWSGPTQYVEGRAPMVRMPDLPEDALRLVYQYLVPLERFDGTAELASAQEILEGPAADSDDESTGVVVSPPRPGTVMLVEGDFASNGEASSYGESDDSDSDDDDSGSDVDSGSDSDADDEDVCEELNERHERLRDVHRTLTRVDARLLQRLHATRGLVSLNSHFRAALQRALHIHRSHHREYADVLNHLALYQKHVDDRRRREFGYESEPNC